VVAAHGASEREEGEEERRTRVEWGFFFPLDGAQTAAFVFFFNFISSLFAVVVRSAASVGRGEGSGY
jgi:hypothetical protein